MPKPSPWSAILRGHLVVTVPVVALFVLFGFLAERAGAPGGWILGVLLAFVPAWLLWSYQIPRWRDWVEDHGLAPDDVQRLGVATGRLWPRGSFPERTEFRRRDGRRGW